MNARYWTSLLGSLVMAVNFPYLACLAALDLPFAHPVYRRGRYYELRAALRRQLGRSRAERPRLLEETALRYRLTDPLAESVHVIRESRAWKLLRLRTYAGVQALISKTLKRALRLRARARGDRP